jgi:hypothetical protein
MKTKHVGLVVALVAVVGVSATVLAGIPVPKQSPWRPLGLSVTAQVQLAGSDSTAASFELKKSTYVSYVNQKLPEGVVFTGNGLSQLDPQRLYFLFDYAPRVYFLKDGAGYKNALGATIATLSAPTNSVLTGNTFTIFPNASSSLGVSGSGSGVESTTEPVLPGDFVQLPTVTAGQQLAFFLMANLNSSAVPEATYYNGVSTNPDNFPHMIAFFPDNSQYILIGFEDILGGGDKDCNDVMFVVDVGPMNAMIWRDPTSLPK